MTEFTVHFQKGSRIGARSLRMITVEASNASQALPIARTQFYDRFNEGGYRVIRIDHFEGDALIIDR